MSDPYVLELEAFRKSKDNAFQRDPHSPIDDRDAFKGLAYFPVDPAYRARVTLVRNPAPAQVTIGTSDGQEREYTNVGRLEATLGGHAVVLHAYQKRGGHSLFVPFRDATSGKESYGAGRYLDLELGPGDAVDLDLNLAYNPYCAYNEAYSCPLPPRENWLTVPIRAGERAPGSG